MFTGMGRFAVTRRRWILASAVLFVAFAAVWGTGVFGALTGAGFDDPDSESYRATQQVATDLGRRDADVVVIYSDPDRTVDDPGFRSAVTGTLDALPAADVTEVTSYYSTRSPAFVSADRHKTYVVVQLAGADEEARDAVYEGLVDAFDAPGLTTEVGGPAAIGYDIGSRVGEDIGRAEALSAPILLVLLLVIFGSLGAAVLPLVIGTLAVLGSFVALRLITGFADVSVFSINVVTLLGLGLAIDYALFVVSRFREELDRGHDVEAAVVRTMATAGRTVAFSGITVAISLAGLLFFPQVFLRSMGYGGIAAVLVAMVTSLTVLPALLAVLGHRVNALRIPLPGARRRAERAAAGEVTEGGWARLARSVMRRPMVYTVAVVALLLALAAPFLRVSFGGVDHRVLPEGTESRVVSESLERDFPGGGITAIDVVATGADRVEVAALVDRITAVEGVTGAAVAQTRGGTSLIEVRHSGAELSDQALDVVADLRALPAPTGGELLVGGPAAEHADLLASLGGILPWTALFVIGVTFVLLFAAFGSILLPIKAILMNVLSLGAAFGVVVWVFQDGHFADVLGFTPTGQISATQPVLMLAILFGLSMDYEVFLLSRVREQWDVTGDNTAAVATGLQQTGRIITSAALLLMVVIGAFSTSGIAFIKLIGVGMAVALLVDATLVRALLVPATMRLLGGANWWAPGPLRRLHERFGIHEGGAAQDGPPPVARPLVDVG